MGFLPRELLSIRESLQRNGVSDLTLLTCRAGLSREGRAMLQGLADVLAVNIHTPKMYAASVQNDSGRVQMQLVERRDGTGVRSSAETSNIPSEGDRNFWHMSSPTPSPGAPDQAAIKNSSAAVSQEKGPSFPTTQQ
jgi:hypothetical protein